MGLLKYLEESERSWADSPSGVEIDKMKYKRENNLPITAELILTVTMESMKYLGHNIGFILGMAVRALPGPTGAWI